MSDGDDASIAHLLAALAAAQSDTARAGRLSGAAEALLQTTGSAWLPTTTAAGPKPEPMPQQGTMTPAFKAARTRGRAMGPRSTVEYALRRRGRVHVPRMRAAHGGGTTGSATGRQDDEDQIGHST